MIKGMYLNKSVRLKKACLANSRRQDKPKTAEQMAILELSRHSSMPAITEDDPLKWWKTNEEEVPWLAKVA